MRFIQVTDIHITPRAEKLCGLDPIRRFEDCIVDINQHKDNVEFCVFTGDLADRGDEASYRVLRELLGGLMVPYYLMIGNHDRRDAFSNVFPEVPRDESGFVQYHIRTPNGVFMFLDTVDEGKASGAYCVDRQRWLAGELRSMKTEPIYLFTHHPPFNINIPSLDRMKLSNPEGLATVIKGHDIRHLFFGHVHRSLSGRWEGIPFSALPSTVHQIATDFVTSNPMPYSHGPPAYAFIDIEDEFILLNLHSYLHQHPRQLPDGTWSELTTRS